MSTRATVHFHRKPGDKPEAIIYRHCDGYPEGLGADLKRFCALLRKEVKDRRFTDPSYFAAKWVVFDAREHAKDYDWKEGKFIPKDTHYLEFLSVGVCRQDPGDIEYRYHVICDGEPTITCEDMDGTKQPIPEPDAAVAA